MADLGSQAAVLTDINSKVTTNGANENTGARVNQCLDNIVDTVYGAIGTVDTARVADKAELQQDILDEANARIAADALKAPLASPTFTGTVAGITKGMVGLGNVDNTSDAAKPVSTAQQTALDTKGKIYSALVTTDDPVVTSGVQNQLGGTPAWSADGAGLSSLTITGAFTVDKTDVQATIGLTDTPAACFCSIRRINANTVQVATFDFGGNLTALPVNVTITVRP